MDTSKSEQICYFFIYFFDSADHEGNILSSGSHSRSLQTQHRRHLKFLRCLQSIDPDWHLHSACFPKQIQREKESSDSHSANSKKYFNLVTLFTWSQPGFLFNVNERVFFLFFVLFKAQFKQMTTNVKKLVLQLPWNIKKRKKNMSRMH